MGHLALDHGSPHDGCLGLHQCPETVQEGDAALTIHRWCHFRHGADIGIRGSGTTPAEAFEQAALALTAVITDPRTIRQKESISLSAKAPDMELLLVDWLNALIYEMTTRRMLFSRFEVKIDGPRLEARAWGEPIERRYHQPAVEIKGATYTELAVHRTEGGWLAQCVVDV